MKKLWKSNLVKNVITSYICMIVFPVMIVLAVAFTAAGRYIYRAAADSVQIAQSAVLNLYQEEMRNTALSLSHVVTMEDGALIQEAASADRQKQSAALDRLNTVYQLLPAPKYQLLDFHIYRQDGSAVIPRWSMRYRVEELREKDWYQKALAQPGVVSTCLAGDEYFYRLRASSEAIAIAAIAPRDMPGIECIALYRRSTIPDTLQDYNKKGNVGHLLLIKEDGSSLIPGDGQIPPQVMAGIRDSSQESCQLSSEGIRYIATKVPGTALFLVSAADEGELFGPFHLFSAVSLIVIFCIVIMFIVYFWWYMNQFWTPLHRLSEGMAAVEGHHLETRVKPCSQKDMAQMIAGFNSMVGQISRLIEEKEAAEKEKYQEELAALQSRMNPHFLMNTLSTLKFMAISAHFDGMRDMVTALETILDALLSRDGTFHTVAKEQSLLESYIYIMQFRYMESFEVEIHISPEAGACQIPKLLLQPIVENSITHGFDGMEEGLGRIRITGQVVDELLLLTVWDNGKGMDEEAIQNQLSLTARPDPEKERRRTIGIRNTNRRLKLNYGEEYGVDIRSLPGHWTCVTMTLPARVPPNGAS